MKHLKFSKYQGTGNDFIMIDNRNSIFNKKDFQFIHALCDRKFGIGADGLILIEDHPQYDFEMIYINPDGSQSLCGNGSRCAVMFASELGIISNETTFLTIEGPLYACIKEKMIHLKMPDVDGIKYTEHNDMFINTGSPHYVRFVKNVQHTDVNFTGRTIRNSKEFQPEGTNVNFVQVEDSQQIFVRTFERGVENETLSCGTGVTASALAMGRELEKGQIDIKTLGGHLAVQFDQVEKGRFTNIYLIGPAEKVFEGQIEV
jgi:diaminopimelate epimerase